MSEQNLPDDYHQNKLTVDLMLAQKVLVADFVKLKNFVAKHKPNPYSYQKSIKGSKQYQKDFKEWDDLMRL